jgi:dienelactone hydrolase
MDAAPQNEDNSRQRQLVARRPLPRFLWYFQEPPLIMARTTNGTHQPRTQRLLLRLVVILFATAALLRDASAAEEAIVQGQVRFVPTAKEDQVAPAFRLERHEFAFEMQRMEYLAENVEAWEVRFPSPMTTPHALNNTVHCEYYRPRDDGQRHPAVIVLHILGGDFPLSRLFCVALAQRGVAALFVKMPYYGPRRGTAGSRRMISRDPRETTEGMTQAVLDIRRAAAWLAEQGEVDSQRLGVFGISLGGITGALAATAEPRLSNVCLLLAGGDIGRVAWESPELRSIRQYWEQQGGTREDFTAALRPIDPVEFAANVRGRRILMLNATDDEVIPRPCTEALWKAFGEPEIHWYPGGHYSVARYLPNAMFRVVEFFATTER